MQPKVDIILVNYNGYTDTVECVKSIKKIAYTNHRIIVVDNGSTIEPKKNQVDYLKSNTYFIESIDNLGFSGGNNIGIDVALREKADYILLLNNDTTVEPDFLDILVETAESNDNVGIVGGKILFYSDPSLVWYAGGEYYRDKGVSSHTLYKQKDKDKANLIQEVSFITGCLMLIPRCVIENVGKLSEEYFLYSEDTDYSCRVANAQYKLIYNNSAVIYHKVSASSGAESPMTQYYMMRNSLLLIRKFGTRKFRSYISHIFTEYKNVFRGRKQFRPIWKGTLDFILKNYGKRSI